MLVRQAALEDVGWFDERFFLFSEETDLCWRLKRAGWEIVHMPQMTICRHENNRWENARLEAQAAYARMQFARKHFPWAAADYRWALAIRYALRVCFYSLLRRYESGRRQAVTSALATVLKGPRALRRAVRALSGSSTRSATFGSSPSGRRGI